ncbi:MAG: hypothetical protein J3Q66DRAFT_329249 [Benniella sp.]|nr:MAG: hypothetical protein J3Q66DRAFT_329249 [Benniella sp.]
MKFASYLAVLASVMALGNVVRADGLENCGSEYDLLTVDSWYNTPPIRGSEICISVKGTLKSAIGNGSILDLRFFSGSTRVFVAVKYLSPLETGPQTFEICVPVPPFSVGDPMGVNFRGLSQEDKIIFCLDGSLTVQSSVLAKTGLRVQG